ncbi:predicted protein [Lichtheimia corymbifera JMRC:FSU:9682]|uniref:Uncharacterized protein n=1 Tax=Lichtheimia corymbifera JMRC:FSU:9682 TaxID=1263082 RepID=A0A068RPW0_9FUNG|nr:predicted protein [Lichtheimia corymbifera JMRC:FSU:9682]
MRTMLISMTKSTSRPSFGVAMGNIGAHGRTPYLCYHPFVISPTFKTFNNELWGLYENEIARRGRKDVV